jgi:hypothetical protein
VEADRSKAMEGSAVLTTVLSRKIRKTPSDMTARTNQRRRSVIENLLYFTF